MPKNIVIPAAATNQEVMAILKSIQVHMVSIDERLKALELEAWHLHSNNRVKRIIRDAADGAHSTKGK